MEKAYFRYKIITNELIVHSQIRSLTSLLEREVSYSVVINQRRTGSVIEFEAMESEEEVLKERLGFTILKQNTAGWIPLI